jgi:hypothetical protein
LYDPHRKENLVRSSFSPSVQLNKLDLGASAQLDVARAIALIMYDLGHQVAT